jgi:hypothetical protein
VAYAHAHVGTRHSLETRAGRAGSDRRSSHGGSSHGGSDSHGGSGSHGGSSSSSSSGSRGGHGSHGADHGFFVSVHFRGKEFDQFDASLNTKAALVLPIGRS